MNQLKLKILQAIDEARNPEREKEFYLNPFIAERLCIANRMMILKYE